MRANADDRGGIRAGSKADGIKMPLRADVELRSIHRQLRHPDTTPPALTEHDKSNATMDRILSLTRNIARCSMRCRERARIIDAAKIEGD